MSSHSSIDEDTDGKMELDSSDAGSSGSSMMERSSSNSQHTSNTANSAIKSRAQVSSHNVIDEALEDDIL